MFSNNSKADPSSSMCGRGGSRGRVQGGAQPPETKPSSYSLLKFDYLTGQ